jgi:hypothetical protein
MGGAVSLQQRCRKALVIRAYNTRSPDQTVEEQFAAFSYLKHDGQCYTNVGLIKQCLQMENQEYPWLEPLLQVLKGKQSETIKEVPNKVRKFSFIFVTFLIFNEKGI